MVLAAHSRERQRTQRDGTHSDRREFQRVWHIGNRAVRDTKTCSPARRVTKIQTRRTAVQVCQFPVTRLIGHMRQTREYPSAMQMC
jgi:hypothetical protein